LIGAHNCAYSALTIENAPLAEGAGHIFPTKMPFKTVSVPLALSLKLWRDLNLKMEPRYGMKGRIACLHVFQWLTALPIRFGFGRRSGIPTKANHFNRGSFSADEYIRPGNKMVDA